uniref:Uncharacterized protein n=1 Tax=Panagrolaimus sp. JU765 TaxID=591449 RepID=A0AC34RKC1_9BILA
MALRFLLDPPPWPEYHHAADQLISADTIVAEEKFHVFKYIDWVRDIPGGIHLPRPPPVTWAPDLIAFVFLLLMLLIGSIIAHNYCSSDANSRYGKHKKLYNFAYKKL